MSNVNPQIQYIQASSTRQFNTIQSPEDQYPIGITQRPQNPFQNQSISRQIFQGAQSQGTPLQQQQVQLTSPENFKFEQNESSFEPTVPRFKESTISQVVRSIDQCSVTNEEIKSEESVSQSGAYDLQPGESQQQQLTSFLGNSNILAICLPGGRKTYQCMFQKCNKTYASKQRLKLHQNSIHYKTARKYGCTERTEDGSQCTFFAYEKSTLTAHIRTHTGDKPYICKFPHCGQAFTIAGNRNDHEKRHYKFRPYSCELCGKSFYRRYLKKKHIQKCSGNRQIINGRTGARVVECLPTQSGEGTQFPVILPTGLAIQDRNIREAGQENVAGTAQPLLNQAQHFFPKNSMKQQMIQIVPADHGMIYNEAAENYEPGFQTTQILQGKEIHHMQQFCNIEQAPNIGQCQISNNLRNTQFMAQENFNSGQNQNNFRGPQHNQTSGMLSMPITYISEPPREFFNNQSKFATVAIPPQQLQNINFFNHQSQDMVNQSLRVVRDIGINPVLLSTEGQVNQYKPAQTIIIQQPCKQVQSLQTIFQPGDGVRFATASNNLIMCPQTSFFKGGIQNQYYSGVNNNIPKFSYTTAKATNLKVHDLCTNVQNQSTPHIQHLGNINSHSEQQDFKNSEFFPNPGFRHQSLNNIQYQVQGITEAANNIIYQQSTSQNYQTSCDKKGKQFENFCQQLASQADTCNQLTHQAISQTRFSGSGNQNSEISLRNFGFKNSEQTLIRTPSINATNLNQNIQNGMHKINQGPQIQREIVDDKHQNHFAQFQQMQTHVMNDMPKFQTEKMISELVPLSCRQPNPPSYLLPIKETNLVSSSANYRQLLIDRYDHMSEMRQLDHIEKNCMNAKNSLNQQPEEELTKFAQSNIDYNLLNKPQLINQGNQLSSATGKFKPDLFVNNDHVNSDVRSNNITSKKSNFQNNSLNEQVNISPSKGMTSNYQECQENPDLQIMLSSYMMPSDLGRSSSQIGNIVLPTIEVKFGSLHLRESNASQHDFQTNQLKYAEERLKCCLFDKVIKKHRMFHQ